MNGNSIIKSLENWTKVAFLKMGNDGKSGIIYCRSLIFTDIFYSKKIGMRYLKNFLKNGQVSPEEFEKVKNEIQNSTLPDK